MALISFTPINKKNIILFFFITISALINFIPEYFNGYKPFDSDLIDYSSQILISLPFLLKKLFKKKKKKHTTNKFPKLDYFIFGIIMIISLIEATIYIIFDDVLFFTFHLFNRNNIDMILLEILSLYTSNTGYFCHHIVGQIIMFISSILVDIFKIFNENNLKLDWNHFLILFLDWTTQNILLTYKKYLMDIKFISPFTICFFFHLLIYHIF